MPEIRIEAEARVIIKPEDPTVPEVIQRESAEAVGLPGFQAPRRGRQNRIRSASSPWPATSRWSSSSRTRASSSRRALENPRDREDRRGRHRRSGTHGRRCPPVAGLARSISIRIAQVLTDPDPVPEYPKRRLRLNFAENKRFPVELNISTRRPGSAIGNGTGNENTANLNQGDRYDPTYS